MEITAIDDENSLAYLCYPFSANLSLEELQAVVLACYEANHNIVIGMTYMVRDEDPARASQAIYATMLSCDYMLLYEMDGNLTGEQLAEVAMAHELGLPIMKIMEGEEDGEGTQ